MDFVQHPTPAPCYVCSDPFQKGQNIIFCPECGSPYHNSGKRGDHDCWNKIWKRCRVLHCEGRSYRLWTWIEPRLLKFLDINQVNINTTCPNCHQNISPLSRYCSICGWDINKPEKQRTFRLYHFARWLRKIRRFLYIIISLIVFILIYGSGIFVRAAAQSVGDQMAKAISNYSTANAPLPTLTPTSTPEFVQPTEIPMTSTSEFVQPTEIPMTSTPEFVQPTQIPMTSTPEFVQPTETIGVSCSNVSANFNHTSKGYILHVNSCSGSGYNLGPLANGAYAIGPNQKFLVYVSASDGRVYAAQIGDNTLTQIDDLKEKSSVFCFSEK